MRSLLLSALLSAGAFRPSAAAPPPKNPGTYEKAPLPLVIWHGLGDDFGREGLQSVVHLAEDANEGTYVYLIKLANDPDGDRQASFLGNVTTQLASVCEQISKDPILSTAPAINALGFSQGGQFLRGYIERCNSPPVHNLVTFGSQHNGISKFQGCQETGDWVCRGTEALLRFGTWSNFVQSRVVPAQYFRDPEDLERYIESSNFLADINNERDKKNETYKENLVQLNRFAMYMFESDKVAIPKESAHFAEVNFTSGEITELKDRLIYKEDWLGLKTLDEQGKLEFKTIPGNHMQFSDDTLLSVFKEYFGPVELDDDKTTQSYVHDDVRLNSQIVLDGET